MALAEKVFEAKMYNVKSQVDGLIGLVKRGRLTQSQAIDEMAIIVMEVGQAITATEAPQG